MHHLKDCLTPDCKCEDILAYYRRRKAVALAADMLGSNQASD